MQLSGALTALITPYQNDKIDEDAFRALVEWQIEQGINGLVPCGTTGESATMSHEEHERVIEICVEQAAGRVPVVAGAGSNYTKEAIRLTRYAQKVGADAALHITPYYNKPTPDGLVEHFKAISQAVDIPLVIYNVPGRTGLNMAPETVARIRREVPAVCALKEAAADMSQVSKIIELCDAKMRVLSGDDFTILPLMSLGGHGVISVISNVLPKETSELCKAVAAGDLAAARRIHYRMMPLCRALFAETNPIPVKTAMSLMGKCDLEFRLPLVKMRPENEEKLRQALSDLKLI